MLVSWPDGNPSIAGDDLSCTHKSKTTTSKVIAAKSCKREAVHDAYLRWDVFHPIVEIIT